MTEPQISPNNRFYTML